MPAKYYINDERFSSLAFLDYSDDKLLSLINLKELNLNGYWDEDNPILHFLLANEEFDIVNRFLQIAHQHIDPNRCDGSTFGKKSLLILMTLLPSSGDLACRFIERYKKDLNFDYQDANGRTALHYAFILGRNDVVDLLITSGASLEIRDNKGKLPSDYLNCSEKLISETLNMIDIDPDRDVKAKQNKITDHFGRPLMLQGEYLVQSKDIIKRVRDQKPVLYKYIEGSSKGWSTFIGDDSKSTYKAMHALAQNIAEDKNTPLKDIFVYEKLSEEENKKFDIMLKDLYSNLSGKSIHRVSLEGHERIEKLELNPHKKRKKTS